MTNNIFELNIANTVIERIDSLTPTTNNLWGKMNVGQMLAHCNIMYEMVYDTIHPRPNAFMRFIITMLAKSAVVGDKPYKKNSRTAPQFIIEGTRDFGVEKNRLIAYIKRTQELGENHFDNKESHSFGKLTKKEWNTLFYKHLDHHLNQFNV